MSFRIFSELGVDYNPTQSQVTTIHNCNTEDYKMHTVFLRDYLHVDGDTYDKIVFKGCSFQLKRRMKPKTVRKGEKENCNNAMMYLKKELGINIF